AIIVARNRLDYRLTAHLIIWLALIYTVSIVVCFGGTTATAKPVEHMWMLVLAASSWLILRDEDRLYANLYVVLCFAGFLFFEIPAVTFAALMPQPFEYRALAQSVSKITQFITMMALIYVYTREIFDAEWHLSLANDRLEELLANMLPATIAERLRLEGRTFADGYANCSVLFADLVGFTAMSASMPPMTLVKLLDQLFSEFDQLTEELGLEKIKTIGDAYMVAAGLPEPRADHATAIVELALRLRAAVERHAGLSLRIGINSGEVVAGIIGRKRFIYDLWGDTVNIASRMESHGMVNEIQISDSTYAAVQTWFECEPRGQVEIKGRGSLAVYLVRGRIATPPVITAGPLQSSADRQLLKREPSRVL
ncbi:MAG: adenylate/guanylate cyclase domain-containing protein, partial [Gammaproteobacteria bacterium]